MNLEYPRRKDSSTLSSPLDAVKPSLSEPKEPVSLTCGRAGLPHEVVVLAGIVGALQVAVRVVQERLGLGLLLQLAGRRVQLLLHPLRDKGGHVSNRRWAGTPVARVNALTPSCCIWMCTSREANSRFSS